ncbi:MAG: hypothetical protein H7123_06585 [Thermoleophilia bacterium]|nr:hypothetical protein [Thermoleophilia bacterium]
MPGAVALGAEGTIPDTGRTTAPKFSKDAQVISVSPVIIDQAVRAGASDSFVVHIANQTSQPWKLGIEISGLAPTHGAARGSGGDLDISAAAAQRDTSASSWLTPSTSMLDLAPGEERDVVIEVAVPANASPGGHYAAVQVVPVPPATAGVKVSARITELVLLSVDGAVRHDLAASIKPAGHVAWSTPVRWHVRLHNGGNVHQLVVPTLRVDPLIGRRVRVTGKPIVIFPGETRILDLRAPVRSAPDLLAATLVLVHQKSASGKSTTSDSKKKSGALLVLPLWFVIALLVTLGVISWRIWRRRGRQLDEHFVDGSADAEWHDNIG